ncbi:MAG: aminotransferase class V-fold PLP-dependent enzyme [Candidatus Micrarchaeia archaeon]
MQSQFKGSQVRLEPPVRRSPLGILEPDREKARQLGVRYRSWKTIAPNWFANAGINRPYSQFILGEPIRVYNRAFELYGQGDVQGIIDLAASETGKARDAVKSVFGRGCTVLFDTNGSSVISTISKGLRGECIPAPFETLTFSNQGRLVYSALGFEAKSVLHFSQNFDQPLCLFDHPPFNSKHPANENIIPPTVNVIDIFDRNRGYKTDSELEGELLQTLSSNPAIRFVLLLHVSRTGRIFPVAEMAAAIRKARPEIAVMVDGCQAIGRMPYQSLKEAFDSCDGYIFVGHKALGSMISGAAALKPGMEGRLSGALRHDLLEHYRLFQFESEELNRQVLSRLDGGFHRLVSLPELVSLRLALGYSVANLGAGMQVAGECASMLRGFLSGFPGLSVLGGGKSHVPDIVTFISEPEGLVFRLKEFLQQGQKPVIIAPLTPRGAARIAIDPKLENLQGALEALKKKIGEFFMQHRG